MTRVSCIIPTMKGREALLVKLISTIPKRYEIIVVDDEDLLLAAKRNKGARQANGEYLFFVDDDNYLAPLAIENAVGTAEQAGVGVVGFMACYDDKQDLIADGGSKRNYLTGFTTGMNTNAFWSKLCKEPYEVDEIANAFLMHSELFYELQGFDEENFPIDLDEADLCKRAKDRGLKIMVDPLARCFHRSITYSPIPDFRRPLNAYCMGKHRINYQRKFNNSLRYGVYLGVFLPVFVCFYTASLIWRRKPIMVFHFLRGIFDGLFCRRKNPYQPR